MKRLLAILLAALWSICAVAGFPPLLQGQGFGAHTPVVAGNPLGVSLGGVSYYGPNQPFLNIMKAAGSGSTYGAMTANGRIVNMWRTSSSGTSDTGEEPYLQVDNDGYVTSLTASPTPGGGQVFTYIQTYMDWTINASVAAPGATYIYPPGPYTVGITGKGTFTFYGDVTSISSCTTGASASGTTITSTTASAWTCSLVLSTPSTGINMAITAIPDNVNYPRAMFVVQTSQYTNYTGGAIFRPEFLTEIANYSTLRFMDWRDTNQDIVELYFTATLNAGATSGTLEYTPWELPTGTYPLLVRTSGQTVTATLTAGSYAVTFTPALTDALNSGSPALWGSNPNWSQRPLESNGTWADQGGVPWEVDIALANLQGINPWINIPADATNSYMASLATLMYGNVNSNLKTYVEFSNEVWNGQFAQSYWALYNAWPLFGATSENDTEWGLAWYGVQVANAAAQFYSIYGGTAYNSRVIVSMGAQASNTFTLTQAMGTSPSSSPPWNTYGGTIPYQQTPAVITAAHIAPYFGVTAPAATGQIATDLATMAADTTWNTFFNQQTGTSTQLTSTPSGGYLAQAVGQVSAYKTVTNSLGLALNEYESGFGWTAYPNYSSGSSVQTMLAAVNRDARIATLYQSYYTQMRTAGASVQNIFVDVGAFNQYGEFGVLESTQQVQSPIASSPYKFQGVQNYMGHF